MFGCNQYMTILPEVQQAVSFEDVNWPGKMSAFAKQVQLGLALIY